jgi:glycosyltransferase involved in cell wall biosynthesis
MRLLYLAWAPYNRRAEGFARDLGAEALFVHNFRYQQIQWSLFKYPLMTARTLAALIRRRPDAVLVMSPPLFAAVWVDLYCSLRRKPWILDAHTGSLISKPWTYFRALHEFLCRRALRTVVTNRFLADLVRSWGGRPVVMNPPVDIPPVNGGKARGGTRLLVVNAFSFDEPLDAVIEAATRFPSVHFDVTGRKSKADPALLARAGKNVHFTDFLPVRDYYSRMACAAGVVCLTTRDHTLQSGGEEAMFMGKPLLTSDFGVLRDFFSRGTVHVRPDPEAIADGIRRLLDRRRALSKEMIRLRGERLADWNRHKEALLRRLEAIQNGGRNA